MEKKVLNYRIIVEKEKQDKGHLYVAYAPSLGISDFGTTVDKAVTHIEEAIKLYIETLADMSKPIPQPDGDEYFVTTRKIEINKPIYHLS